MKENKQSISSALRYIFIGLIVFLVPNFNIEVFNSSYITSIVGSVFVLIGCYQLMSASKFFKKAFILFLATGIVNLASIFYSLFTGATTNIDIPSDISTIEIPEGFGVLLIILGVITIISMIVRLLSFVYLIRGIKDICMTNNIHALSEMANSREKGMKICSIFLMVASLVVIVLTMDLVVGVQRWTAGQINDAQFLSSTSLMLLGSLVMLVAAICYLVTMIKLLIYVNKVTNAISALENDKDNAFGSNATSDVDVVIKPKDKNDKWDDEIK